MSVGMGGVQRRSDLASLLRNMVGVAQLVEHGIVTPVVVGSIPIVHPIFRKAPDLTVWRLFCFCWLESSAAAGTGPQWQGVSSYLCFSMMLRCPLFLLAGSAVGVMPSRLFYIKEGLAQSPGVIGCICHGGEVLWCIRPYKLPAAFLPVLSRVTS